MAEISNEEHLKIIEKSVNPKHDPVNHPSHYTFGKYEVIDVLDDWNLPFTLANTVKYIARAGKKVVGTNSIKGDIIQDLEKAKWYLEHEINKLKNAQEKGS